MFWKLFVAFAVLVAAAATLLGWLVLSFAEEYLLAAVQQDLLDKAVLIEDQTLPRLAKTDSSELRREIESLGKRIQTRITLVGRDGRVLADSAENAARMENHGSRPEIREAARSGTGVSRRYSTSVHFPMMYLAKKIDADGSETDSQASPWPGGFVRVAVPLDTVQGQLTNLRQWVAACAIGSAAAASLVGFWFVRRITGPLKAITETARALAAGDYARRVYLRRRDEVGELAATFNQMSEDLTRQVQQTKADRERLSAVLSGMQEGVIAVDRDDRVVFANQAACALFGLDGDKAVGRGLWELVRHRAVQEVVRGVLAQPASVQTEVYIQVPVPRALALYGTRLGGAAASGAILVFHDVSEIRRLERMRAEFTANVSHELKTPLTVIKAHAETLLDGALNDPEHNVRFLRRIAEQADRLYLLIQDLLSLSRIESGEEVLDLRPCSVRAAAAASAEGYLFAAQAKNIRLEIAETAEDILVVADAEALRHILDNLIDNAIKYTPSGGRVSVRWTGDETHGDLEIEDTGIGIPEKELPRIFERFYRVDKARSRELGGTGLGLSIVKHLAEVCGGKVSARSRVGEGSTFVVTLPRAAAAQAAAH